MKNALATGTTKPGPTWLRLWPMLVLLALVTTTTAGCRGCIKTNAKQLSKEEEEKKAKEEKEALVLGEMQGLPTDAETKLLRVKPGHWVETSRDYKSTREDLQVLVTGDVIRGADRMLTVPGTNILPSYSRPTSLPKGQKKSVDLQYFVPTSQAVLIDPTRGESNVLKLRSGLLSRNVLAPLLEEPYSVDELKHHQFFFVVACPIPLEYRYLTASDVVLWKGESLSFSERIRSYQVILCDATESRLKLPNSMLSMTTMAVLLWDDVPPDSLSEEQKNAILDWVHWGGQLIISGPDSWARLQNSFLTPYLPVRTAESAPLNTESFAELSSTWAVEDVSGRPRDPLQIVGPNVTGLKLELSDSGSYLPKAGDLVAERSLGRGRIVFTAFPLRERRIIQWKYFSNFLSTGLLRRPSRTLERNLDDGMWRQTWRHPYTGMESDPRLNSNFRIASRDLPLSRKTSTEFPELLQSSMTDIKERMREPSRFVGVQEEQVVEPKQFIDNGAEPVQWSPNGAAWSDSSALTFQVVTALREAAGIVLPDRWTILYLLAGYLTILVPVNWIVFRLFRRLEYAWIAAPIIALVGVIVVTRVARLDIGFARRSTQIGLLEIQPNYKRAHLTNYMALYTSLSTNYALDYVEPGSVALPLGDLVRKNIRAINSTRRMTANYGSSEGIRIEPLTVFSNSTEMIHAEQMLSVGEILFEPLPDSSDAMVKNSTELPIKSSLIVRMTARGFEYAWVGDLDAKQTKKVTFAAADRDAVWKQWNTNPVTCRPSDRDARMAEVAAADGDASDLFLGGILDELLYATPLVQGQTRLLGYSDETPSQPKVSPQSDQFDSRLVILAHLTPAKLGEVTPDAKVVGVVGGQNDNTIEDNLSLPPELREPAR